MDKYFQNFQLNFLEDCIQNVVKEQTLIDSGTKIADHIDAQEDVQTARQSTRSCSTYMVSFKDGKFSQQKLVDTSKRYNLVESQHEVDPNSFLNVKQVLAHLKTMASTDERQWVSVVVDGQPYSLIRKIMS